MPCFNVVGCSRALSVEVIPNSMVAFNPLGYDVVCEWRCVCWEVGVIQILQTVKPCVLYLWCSGTSGNAAARLTSFLMSSLSRYGICRPVIYALRHIHCV
jgi:hypothetical protein